MIRSRHICLFSTFLLLLASVPFATSQQRREREPNSVYASRRTALTSQCEGPIILKGFTGREEFSQTYIFSQEDNFYYPLATMKKAQVSSFFLPREVPVAQTKSSSSLQKIPRLRNGTASVCPPRILTSKPGRAFPP